jgi:hypothetical protein
MTAVARVAGTSVRPTGAGSLNSPNQSPNPATATAATYTPYVRIPKQTMPPATSAADSPEAQIPHAVTATPPAPAAATSFVAAARRA